ncbi:MAG TPA: choice-of-anchor L domain-containing protein [Actinomycetaceae bacterium]|nr:choice-of-anchor L domain-containing protein [Actinomycetaceae bacterium]
MPIGNEPSARAENGSAGFSDVPEDIMFYDEIMWLASTGITTGWPDETYRPLDPVNRDAMGAFLYRMSGSVRVSPPLVSEFTDMTPGTQFYKEIAWLAQSGITTGWPDGTFRPVVPIARDAMAAFIYRLARQPEFVPPSKSPFVDVDTDDQFYKEITWLESTGIATGWDDGTFRPLQPIARDAMAAFLYRFDREFGDPVPVLDASVIGVTADSVTLTFSVPDGANVVVRRTSGDEPAMEPTEGTGLAVSGDTLEDNSVLPGTRYHYSLWVDQSATTMATTRLYGPLVLTVGTSSDDPEDATYVLAPTTLLPEHLDLTNVTSTATGASIGLGSQSRVPGVGAGVILPASAEFPAGFLGRVTEVSHDGTSATLEQGGIGDAFDYYKLSVPDLGALPMTSSEGDESEGDESEGDESPAAAAGLATVDEPVLNEEQLAAQQRSERTRLEDNNAPMAMNAPTAAPMAKGLQDCLGVGASGTLLDIGLTKPTAAGHFDMEWSHGQFLGVKYPDGVSLDARIAVTLGVQMSADIEASVTCGLPLAKFLITLPGVAPLALYVNPAAEVSITSGLQVSNIGMTATGGFEMSGYLGLNGENHFDSGIINSVNPMTPEVSARTGSLGLTVGVGVYVGPGAGTQDVGAIVGIGGDWDLMKVQASVAVPSDPARVPCLTLNAGGNIAVNVTARAWAGPFSADVNVEVLDKPFDYFEKPKHFPSGCQLEPPDPSEDVLGPGVTLLEDVVVGTPAQWGYLDGFSDSGPAWLLSTGVAQEAVNSPGFFASTDLQMPGDEHLSALSGWATRDAASYTAKVVPAGDTINVKYMFASEEYPDFVDSVFNDVMAIYVDGTNCAFVPGTDDPVSVNTVNAGTNSEYFRANHDGSAAPSVAYGGMTVPLTCSVPVTPGQPVTVSIAIADASDAVYDSAIALMDKGIWSE